MKFEQFIEATRPAIRTAKYYITAEIPGITSEPVMVRFKQWNTSDAEYYDYYDRMGEEEDVVSPGYENRTQSGQMVIITPQPERTANKAKFAQPKTKLYDFRNEKDVAPGVEEVHPRGIDIAEPRLPGIVSAPADPFEPELSKVITPRTLQKIQDALIEGDPHGITYRYDNTVMTMSERPRDQWAELADEYNKRQDILYDEKMEQYHRDLAKTKALRAGGEFHFWPWTHRWINVDSKEIIWKRHKIVIHSKINTNAKRMEFYNRFYMDLALQLPMNEWILITGHEQRWQRTLSMMNGASGTKASRPTLYKPSKDFNEYYRQNIATKKSRFMDGSFSATVLYRAIPKFIKLGYMEGMLSAKDDPTDPELDADGPIMFKLIKPIKDIEGPGSEEAAISGITSMF